jgi:protein-L-isoaspartate(D-aspartate) O-methyltransferase
MSPERSNAQAADPLAAERRWFAEELRAVANLESDALVDAFARVRREHYLGPGPWPIARPGLVPDGGGAYHLSPDADPRRLLHNVLVGIDLDKGLNNGQPTALALWIEALRIRPGERALHVGCGVGYYTAILAELVGPGGHVLGIELERELAARAATNLAHLPHVEVRAGDATAVDTGPFDAALINAGVTRIPAAWLDRMAPGARLIVPLTARMYGLMLLVTRHDHGFGARFHSGVGMYDCAGARDPASEARLAELLRGRRWRRVRSLRRDRHPADETCALHDPGGCLSTRSPG